MATIKHLSSKNSNYAAAESYLTFQHNEYTGLPILDGQGRPKLRDSYLLDTIECGESSFAMACLIANRKYGKNDRREDVKTHHYIISFDPKDAVENGLTMESAQALGLQFCKENFPGHPAIVCTHPDGHNSAGNIHVHIVISSLRVRTVERQPFMDNTDYVKYLLDCSALPDPQIENELRKYWEGLYERLEKEERRLA